MTDLKSTPVPTSVDPAAWSLSVDGRVAEPHRFDRRALLDLADTSLEDDFACAEGWTADGLRWEGVDLTTILSRVRPDEGATAALVHGMDEGYACGLPLERLETGLLALRLDGEALPVEHGGPARLVLPGDGDCWEGVKWVEAIEILDEVPPEADTARELALSRLD